MSVKGIMAGIAGVVMLAAVASGEAAAQGNVGGTIGKKNKVISGDTPSAPARTQRPAKAKAVKQERAASIDGTWKWVANCERNVKFDGTLTFVKTGNTFTATHGHTNMFDTGTITNGRINGNRVNFTRRSARDLDHVELRLSGGRMSGVLPNSRSSGRCTLTATKQ